MFYKSVIWVGIVATSKGKGNNGVCHFKWFKAIVIGIKIRDCGRNRRSPEWRHPKRIFFHFDRKIRRKFEAQFWMGPTTLIRLDCEKRSRDLLWEFKGIMLWKKMVNTRSVGSLLTKECAQHLLDRRTRFFPGIVCLSSTRYLHIDNSVEIFACSLNLVSCTWTYLLPLCFSYL